MTYLTKVTRGASAPLSFLCALTLFVGGAQAADENGKYAIKGAGLQSCGKFLSAMDEQSSDIALYGGWIEGFISAQNQRMENTFDMAPWQTTSTLLALSKSACEQTSTETRFVDAFAGVFRFLAPDRLTQQSEIVGIKSGSGQAIAYRAVIEQLKDKLRIAGFETGDAAGAYTEATTDAIKAYQQSKGLQATGLPDQPTLFELFARR